MKILLFTIEYPPFKGGIANYYENIAKYWPKKDNFFVLHNNNNKLISNLIYPKWLPAIWQLYKIIKQKKINHIFVGHILPLGTIVFLLSKFLKIKYSVFIHGMDLSFALKNKRKKKIAYKILQNAQNIFCNSNYSANLVNNFISCNKKIKVIYPGIKMPSLKKYDHKKYKNKFILLTVARLTKRKGQDMVIKIFNRLSEKIPNLYYYIAGEGPDRKYLEKLSNNNPRIKFLGKVNEEKKWELLQACDIFVMPSRNIKGDAEGFGISFLEAALVKKPSIAGKSGGVKEAVINYETGILVNPESENDIFNGIIKLANDFDLRNNLGEKAMKRALKDFNWQKQVDEISTTLL